MTPVLSIVGRSDAGKTTLLEGLIAELKGRGYRVATIKHDVHGFEIDQPGKDSWRHAQAGSEAVVISSPEKLALIRRVDHDWSMEEIGQLLGDFDITLTEGYKAGGAPKLEVHRHELGEGLLCTPEELIAVATDEPLEMPLPQFDLKDFPGMADLIEKRLLQGRGLEETALFVDGAPIPLSPFAREIIARTVRGMLSALKGVGDPRSILLHIRR